MCSFVGSCFRHWSRGHHSAAEQTNAYSIYWPVLLSSLICSFINNCPINNGNGRQCYRHFLYGRPGHGGWGRQRGVATSSTCVRTSILCRRTNKTLFICSDFFNLLCMLIMYALLWSCNKQVATPTALRYQPDDLLLFGYQMTY